ncbi:GTPase Era [Enterobacteriaceae bacterium ET-AT1-13]|nr:GTPase Era [Enterobacteriaceae bacterium ET-AT1-13]WGS66509.1 GTPase Era [Enterobacteriaceae bacterium Cmel17]WMC17533.1 MAG: GTPase Era [Enterobacteriaceae bacterium Cmel21]WMC17740.1 MAG: GTPase Era [Enterobacteriaceae bacterium PSmelAO3-2]WMC17944.1 MAG: GTPase Era [Enterobacteriaceae bacterium PSmelAO3-1]WMC18146.1 MAG: GTPase Era [Enterobacteriaceae bacterium PSmelAO1]
MFLKEKIYGFVSIIGRTNSGKSTLFNKLIGKKISITSKKKNTTINNILGIYKKNLHKIIYIDNPGFIINKNNKNIINYNINNIKYNIDIIIYIIEGTILKNYDLKIINNFKKIKCPIIVIINKIDIIKKKIYLLPYIKFLSKNINFNEIIPISAKFNININIIKKKIFTILYKKNNLNYYFYNKYSENFIISEIIREKLIRFLGQELPYSTNVKIEKKYINNNYYNIFVLILVKKKSQKKIIIGKNGNKIKIISIYSKKEIERKLKKKINLFLKIIII